MISALKRCALATTLALVVAASGLSAAPSRSAADAWRPSCRDSRARVVAANAVVRVLRRRSEVWACHRSSRRTAELGVVGGDDQARIRSVRVAGRFVAFERSCYCVHEGTEFHVVVLDARRRRTTRTAPSGALPEDRRQTTADAGIGPTTDLELEPDGSVAWIARDVYASPSTYEVHLADASGHRRLARSADVEPRSLAISGGRLYWTAGGAPQSAVID